MRGGSPPISGEGCEQRALSERLSCAKPGNEAVLRARFEDAQFFYAADLRQPLEAFLPKLAGSQFHKDLGNLLEKSERVAALVAPLAEATGLAGEARGGVLLVQA